MVLANGQYVFTCGDTLGFYDLDVPLDANGEITLYGFCSGFSPFKAILTPDQALNFDINMTRAASGSREIEMTIQTEAATTNQDWVRIRGTRTTTAVRMSVIFSAICSRWARRATGER